MQIVKRLKKVWKTRFKYRDFKSMPSWLLALLGGPASLVAFYWAFVVSQVTPEYITIVNKNGFDLAGIALGTFIIILALGALFYAAITKRTGELLYKIYFK